MPALVTTFPPRAWDIYARECIESMVQNWPGSITAYFEGTAPPSLDGVEFRPFTDPARETFLARKLEDKKPGYLYAAKPFCHKVFAQLEFAATAEAPFWWVDADVMMYYPIPEHALSVPDFCCFFGREKSYTETGMIGFDPTHPDWPAFAHRYRRMYTKAKVLELPYWTDCHAFDAAREGGGHNMSPNGKGVDNVIAESHLGQYLAHLKGTRKRDVYRGGADAYRPSL